MKLSDVKSAAAICAVASALALGVLSQGKASASTSQQAVTDSAKVEPMAVNPEVCW